MSGGAWGYQSAQFEETAERVANALRLLGRIEHVLDWGVCGDTCQDCAERRVIAMLIAFFETSGDFEAASEAENQAEWCDVCKAHHASLIARRTP